MCGILVITGTQLDLGNEIRAAVASRGPDHYGSEVYDDITFESSVLSLREPFTAQPVVDGNTILCYNGQVYGVDEQGLAVHDTNFVQNLCQRGEWSKLMSSEGEFAFVFCDGTQIWFGRDVLGRRSLVYRLDDELIICSTAAGLPDFIECDAGGKLYSYSLQTKKISEHLIDGIPRFTVSVSGVPPVPSAEQLLSALKSAVTRRTVQPNPKDGVAVLFSGGVDCTIVAALLDDVLPHDAPIELVNVAFENRRTGSMWDTPDRVLAKRTFSELKARSLGPHRLQLVEINVPYEVTQEHKQQVKDLMAPTETVMDLSIALAFYFASKPQHNLSNPKLLFSGLGADELFAGYSRHTGAASNPHELASELQMDFDRLPHRSLGRDDRVTCCWGREVRYPFLDREVINVAEKMPLSHKTDGTTTKIVLREAAKTLGLTDVVNEKKRAIQFGSRSAKMDPGSGNSKGHHQLK